MKHVTGDTISLILFTLCAGMNRMGELEVIAVRYINDDLEPVVRLLALETLEKTPTADQLASFIQLQFVSALGIGSLKRIVASMHDNTSTNRLCTQKLVRCVNINIMRTMLVIRVLSSAVLDYHQ